VYIQQWDGKRWNKVSDWIAPIQDVVWPQITAAANKYAKENKVKPRTCSTAS
jgi:branched-chain amino acid transport system substrate-binding protein